MATDNHTPPLTAARVESLKPRAERYDVRDTAAPGLQLRVTPKGVKSFRWSTRADGKLRWVTIGTWSMTPKDGHVTLSEARMWLERLKAAAKVGQLADVEAELTAQKPKALRAKAKEAAEAPAGRTVADLVHDYLRVKERTVEKPAAIERCFRLHILPVLGAMAPTAVKTRDCSRVVETLAERGLHAAATKARRQMSEVFDYGIARGEMESNPAAPLKLAALGVESSVCTRYLTAEEVPVFWQGLTDAVAAERLSAVNATGLKLLLATGVRSCELLKARWEDVDLDRGLWSIPVANQKMKKRERARAKPWVIPLSTLALSLFGELKEHTGDEPFVMDQTGGEKTFARAMKRLLEKLPLVEPRPTPHDLRRSVRTHLGELGVSWHVAERCLNHSLGGITKVYDVGDYRDERKAALEKWGAYVQRLVDPSSSNVRFLGGAR